MKTNLDNGVHDGPQDLQKDFVKVISTAQGHFLGRPDVHEAAENLEKAFKELWKKFVLPAER